MKAAIWGRVVSASILIFMATVAIAQDATTQAPDNFTLAFENGEIRAILGRIGPGETTPVFLSTRGLNVWLTDAELEIAVQGGPTLQTIHQADETQWLSADWRLSLTNTGAAEVRWVHIETGLQEQESQQESVLPFRLLQPDTIEANRLYPLVVFLHGYGERGIDNESQLLHGVPELLAFGENHDQPMFLLAPQHGEVPWHPANILANERFDFPDTPNEPVRQILDLIEEQLERHPIDPDRIYLTGLSMGAFGVWDMLLRTPDRFAAAIPVAGGAPQDGTFAPNTAPVWILHGADDRTVHPDHSTRAYATATKQGLDVQLTIVPGLRHDQDAWRQMYSDRQVLAWLFDKRRD